MYKSQYQVFTDATRKQRKDASIEGLRHGGAAEYLRHSLTPFGSGWQGLSTSPFSLRPYARALANVYGPKTRMYSDTGRSLTRRESLQVAGEIRPFMSKPELKYLGEGYESDVFSLSKKHVIKFSTPDKTVKEGVGRSLDIDELKGIRGVLQPNYRKNITKGLEVSVYPKARVTKSGLWSRLTKSSGEWEVNLQETLAMHSKLANQGVNWTDFAQRNMGRVNGKAMVIDAGLMYKIPGQEITKAIVKSGEGRAIVNAGTATISKIVTGARRIMTSL